MRPLQIHMDHALRAAVLLAVFVAAIGTAFADKARRPAGSRTETTKERSAKTAAAYATPVNGAVSTAVRAIGTGRTQNGTRQQARVNVGTDTAKRENRIVFARASADVFTVKIELMNDEQNLDVGIYNMLGKKVLDVYKGYASRGPHEYTTAIQDLPEGVYICIVQGSDFRKAEKFYFNR